MRSLRFWIGILWLAGLSACSHVISAPTLALLTPGLTPAAVHTAPAEHLDQTLLLGGNILGIMPEETGTTLEIFSWKLDRQGYPLENDEAGGRFLAVSDRWLDPYLFAPGRFVALVGTVTGQEIVDLGGYDYTYPRLRIVEIHPLDVPLRSITPTRLHNEIPGYGSPWYQRDNPYDPGPVGTPNVPQPEPYHR